MFDLDGGELSISIVHPCIHPSVRPSLEKFGSGDVEIRKMMRNPKQQQLVRNVSNFPEQVVFDVQEFLVNGLFTDMAVSVIEGETMYTIR